MMKTVITVDASLVDAANDTIKLLVVLMVSLFYNQYLAGQFGLSQGPSWGGVTGAGVKMALTTAGVVGIGLAIYHVVVAKVIMFMPHAGQASYYMSMKRS